MEQFSALQTFVSVVDTGGFSAAGEALGISTSVVSRQIAALEAELGVQLLKRSTRTVALTEAGTAYLGYVRRLLHDLAETNRSLKASTPGRAAGTLRIAAPTALGLTLVAPAVADFMAGNPDIVMHLDLLDRSVDLTQEDYDLSLCIGEGPVAAGRRLGQVETGLFSSPSYLALRGRPHGPADLIDHWALYGAGQMSWNLRGGQAEKPRMKFHANRLEALKTLCLAGQGVALLPHFLVGEELERGELVQLLDGFEPKPLSLFVARPPHRTETAASRLFQNFLEARFKRMRL